MPCSSSEGMGDAYREDPEARRQLEAMKKELDTVTRILCSLLKKIPPSSMTAEQIEWYDKHKKWDKSQGRK